MHDFGFWEAATYNGKSSNISATFTVTVFVGARVEATEQSSGMGCYPIIQQAVPMPSLKTGDEKCFGDQMTL
jgi:hypothetical protein